MRFFVLRNPRVTKQKDMAITDFLKSDDANTGEAPICPVCGEFIGMLPWLPPYRAELEVWGKAYGDIAFGAGDEMLVSARFAMLYKEATLIGLEGFKETEILKIKRRGGSRLRLPPPKYYCVKVVRSRAAINIKASGLVLREPPTCDECRDGFIIRTQRVILEENTWSGEDVFFARGLPGTIITSERFKDFFEDKGINNGLLIPAEDYSFDFYSDGKVGP